MARFSLTDRPATAKLLILYVAYMLAAGFGQWMMIPHISITVWPPNGVVLAALLSNDRRSWHWWIAVAAAGELTSNLIWFHNPILPALGYVTANVLEVVVAALILASSFKLPVIRLTTLGQVLTFLGVGVLAAPVIGATLGSAIDAAMGKNPFPVVWPFWWLGDATGILLATPLVISAVNAWREKAWPTASQLVEAAAIMLTLAGLGIWQFSNHLPAPFILFIPILWAALRFEFRGATLAVLVLALIVGFHAQDAGSQAQPTGGAAYRNAMLQILIIVAASTGLIIAAMIRQYRHTAIELTTTNRELEQRVIERTREIEAADRRFRATFENAAVGISIINSDSVFVRVNDSLARMLDYRVDELEGRPLNQVTHPDDLADGQLAWDRLESGSAEQYELEKRYVRKDGETIWGHTSVSCVRKPDGKIDYVIKVIQDISGRKRADEARQMLMNEVNHRSNNMLAMVQVIARQTAVKTPDDFIENFERRVQALAANQSLLSRSGWEPVSLMDLVHGQLSHFSGILEERFVIRGPQVLVPARVAQVIGMALYELATNAAKYGSLSNDCGRVEIVWKIDGNEFHMLWSEAEGPKVDKPKIRGFGSTVIDSMVRFTLGGDVSIDFATTGLVWRLRCSLSAVRGETIRSQPSSAPPLGSKGEASNRSLEEAAATKAP